jgi:diacylglycerol kinase (ATP)
VTGPSRSRPLSDRSEQPDVWRPRRVAVVFNPAAGGERAPAWRDHTRQALAAAGVEVTWTETTEEEPGTGLARKAVEDGADLVIACGGDGTVRACATALAGGEVPLAVLPLGTGNLVATNFEIPDDVDQALEVALVCRRRRIDVGALGEDRFVAAAGIGFDAAMLRDAHSGAKGRFGPLAYVLSGLRNLRRPRTGLRIRLDGGEPFDRRGQGVLVCNLGRIQGRLPILPDAVPDDGLLDLAVLKTRNLRDWALVAVSVLTRRPDAAPAVETFRARTVEVTCATPQPVERDGDTLPPRTQLKVELLPYALTLAVPAPQPRGSGGPEQLRVPRSTTGSGHQTAPARRHR